MPGSHDVCLHISDCYNVSEGVSFLLGVLLIELRKGKKWRTLGHGVEGVLPEISSWAYMYLHYS
jgi:hypothetical protein